jgi:anthranilate 1,2-dioxygenase (deaminating, decarboxylating) small subunit
MNLTPDHAFRAAQLVQLEGLLLDEQDWDRWLALYEPDCEYWVPMWDDDGTPTRDPERELSLIYYASRSGLEDRVFRIRTGQSAASTPMFRTAHVRGAPVCEWSADGLLVARFAWVTYAFRLGKSHSYFGRSTLTLRERDGQLRIARSHILVANDLIDQVLDIYHL